MAADNQSQLEILIKTIADTTGFTLTREQAAATQQALGKYAESTADLGKKTEAAGLIQEKSTAYVRAQFVLFTELNKIVPGLGMALHAAFAGPLGPIILLAAGIAEVTSLIKAQNAALDEQAKAGANADFLDAIQSRLAVFTNAAASAQQFADGLKNIEDNSKSAKTELEGQIKTLQALERAQAALTSAQKELEIARIQQDEATGKITPEQAAERRAKTEKDYLEKSQKDKEAAQHKDLATRQAAADKARQSQTGFDYAATGATARVTAEEAHAAAVKVDPKEQAEKEKAAQAELDKANATVESQKKWNMAERGIGMTTPAMDAQQIANLQAVADKAAAKLSALREQDKEFAATQTPQAAAKLQHDKKAAERAEKRAEENAAFAAEQQRQIDQEKATQSGTRPIEEQTMQIKEKTVESQETTRQTKQAKADVGAIESFERSANPSPELISKAAQAIAEWQSVPAAIQELVAALAGLDAKQLKADMADAKRKIAEIQSQLSHHGP
jgi:hypothetical protein